MRLHAVRHVPYEGLGHIEPWARARGFEIAETRSFAGESLPEPDAADLHVVLGGPLSANDDSRHEWLAHEKRWLRELVAAEVPTLGICLGSQLLASVLGATVRTHTHPEIGWHPVEPAPGTDDDLLAPFFAPGARVLQWHYDTFDLPEGARWLARSAGCAHQAFAWGDALLAVQFHPEMTRSEVATLVERDDPLPDGDWVDTPGRLLEPARFDAQEKTTNTFLDRLATVWNLVAGGSFSEPR